MTIGLPAHADMRTMTLKGHRFYFDIPDGYVEEAQQPEYAEHSKKFKSPSTGTGIYFSVVSGRTLQQQMDFYDTKFQRDYLFDGRVGRAMSAGSDHQYLFSTVFAASCSGACIIAIVVGGAAGNSENKPFDFDQARSFLDSYANQLGRGGFEGN